MKVIKNIKVPTGNILITQGEKGKMLECLSIGDYGKEANLKADFLGLHDEINGVAHQELLPLEEKWVVTISTQYGCSSGCTFCDVPKVGAGINCTIDDIINQVEACIALHPEVTHTDRLNLHFARMGEPIWNPDIFDAMHMLLKTWQSTHNFHPVISTMMPKNNKFLELFLVDWMSVKNEWMDGEAGLQLSINSTDDAQRDEMFSGSAMALKDIGEMVQRLPDPKGRKITLNFALNDTYEVNPQKLLDYGFDPKKFLCKITPMHVTNACVDNGLQTSEGYGSFYPYEKAEADLKAAGYDVIVFVPSREEDESRITCGNAILSDFAGERRTTILE